MAEHVWSVLCRRGIQDAETGVVSLIEVTERLLLPSEATAEVELAQAKNNRGIKIPHSMQVVSWWVRSDYDREEVSDKLRAFIITPGNFKLAFPEETLVMSGATTGTRVFYRIEDLPFEGFGLYWITIEQQRTNTGHKARNTQWKTVARLPLEILATPGS